MIKLIPYPAPVSWGVNKILRQNRYHVLSPFCLRELKNPTIKPLPYLVSVLSWGAKKESYYKTAACPVTVLSSGVKSTRKAKDWRARYFLKESEDSNP